MSPVSIQSYSTRLAAGLMPATSPVSGHTFPFCEMYTLVLRGDRQGHEAADEINSDEAL